MGKYCIEEITMGFNFPEPKSVFYGHFDTEENAIEWAREHYKDWKEFNEGQTFFQKDLGMSVREAYIQNCEDEDFLSYSSYTKSKIIIVK